MSMSFQEYKQLTPEEREFFVFQQLAKIDQLDTISDRFASKWVEKAAIGMSIFILLGFLASLMLLVHFQPSGIAITSQLYA